MKILLRANFSQDDLKVDITSQYFLKIPQECRNNTGTQKTKSQCPPPNQCGMGLGAMAGPEARWVIEDEDEGSGELSDRHGS